MCAVDALPACVKFNTTCNIYHCKNMTLNDLTVNASNNGNDDIDENFNDTLGALEDLKLNAFFFFP